MTGATRNNGAERDRDGKALLLSLFAGILTLVVAMGIGRFAYTPILPAMQERFDLTSAAMGVLASSNYLGYLVGAILTAVVALGASRNTLLRASLLAVVATTGLMAFTADFGAWIALRFLAGLASAGVFVLASGAVLGALRRRGRPDLSGWLYSGVGLGISLSGLVVLALDNLPARDSAGWRVDWIALALLAAALVASCWAWLPKEAPHATSESAEQPLGDANRGLGIMIVLLWIAYFFEGTGYIVSGTFLVKIVEEMPGLEGLGTSVWILVGLAAAPSTVLWAKVASRMGYVSTLVVAYAAQAVGIALPVFSGTGWAAMGSAVLFGGTFMGITALTLTFAGRVTPRRSAQVIGALTAAFGFGQVVGPLLPAALARGPGDFGPSLLAAAAIVLLGGLLMIAVGVAARRGKGATGETR